MALSERVLLDRDKLAEYLTPIGFGISIIALWEVAVRLFRIPLYIIPPPSSILVEYARNFHRIWDYTLVTGMETLSGFAVAILLGVPLSMFVAFSAFLRRTFYPLAVTLEMVPKIVFAPIFVTWFGFGFLPKILIVFLVCFFPILLNGILAFTSLSLDLTRFCLSTGAGPLRTFFKVRLPAALPQLFVGIKGAGAMPASATTSRSPPAISGWIWPSPSSSCWPLSVCCCSGSSCWRSAGSFPGMSPSGRPMAS